MTQQNFEIPEINLSKKQILRLANLLWIIPLMIVVFDSWYTVQQDEVGVVQRFGKYVKSSAPGFHIKFPFRIDTVRKVLVKRQLKEEFGFRTLQAGVRSQYSEKDYYGESIMLSGDLSIGDVEWIVQYKINDPEKWLFKVRDVRGTFRNICEAVMREVIGNRSINEVLTTGREEIGVEALVKIQELCTQYETGIDVNIVVLQDVNPPAAVKSSFNEVNQSLQEKENMINKARAQYNKVIPKAKGLALKQIQEAEGYALRRVNESKGDVARFSQVLIEYRKAPEITKKRLYLETMGEIIPKMGKVIIIDEDAKSVLPLLNLNKEVTP